MIQRVSAVAVVALGSFLGYAVAAGYLGVFPTPWNVVVGAFVFGMTILAAIQLWR